MATTMLIIGGLCWKDWH